MIGSTSSPNLRVRLYSLTDSPIATVLLDWSVVQRTANSPEPNCRSVLALPIQIGHHTLEGRPEIANQGTQPIPARLSLLIGCGPLPAVTVLPVATASVSSSMTMVHDPPDISWTSVHCRAFASAASASWTVSLSPMSWASNQALIKPQTIGVSTATLEFYPLPMVSRWEGYFDRILAVGGCQQCSCLRRRTPDRPVARLRRAVPAAMSRRRLREGRRVCRSMQQCWPLRRQLRSCDRRASRPHESRRRRSRRRSCLASRGIRLHRPRMPTGRRECRRIRRHPRSVEANSPRRQAPPFFDYSSGDRACGARRSHDRSCRRSGQHSALNDELLADLHKVDAETWLPPPAARSVQPDDQASVVADMIADILRQGFSMKYTFPAGHHRQPGRTQRRRLRPIVCGWINAWFDAQHRRQ